MPAARDHLQVAVLLEPEGREGERRPGDERRRGPEAELAREQVGAEERQRVGEQEQQVVARPRRRAAPSRSARPARSRAARRRRRACRASGQNWFAWKKSSGWWASAWPPQATCHACASGSPRSLRDVLAQVQDQRPVHDDREQAGAEREQQQLARGDPALLGGRHGAGSCQRRPVRGRQRPAGPPVDEASQT